ncbi:hypothetical protein NKR19_g953 [Coniochaeta hoffmannii]|uniref:Uncharacterized protein n=1 Tax=Coniochaeta hoffmannii TaxID=91930 RepID=A0AA38W3T8_9PEZI|nr:hypothetical protein NKR19_g953 [Coniochaeta hoffmannii]
MADTSDVPPPTLRCESPTPDNSPLPALGSRKTMDRCLSTASSASHGSATTDASHMRESLGSDISAYSRHSSSSFLSSRQSDVSNVGSQPSLSRMSSRSSLRTASGATRRRGYMRPTGTDFAASAKSRESVLSLGSIAHLQYYFARTGLLDGKGGQLARKRKQQNGQMLDLSALDTTSFKNARLSSGDVDSSYASMGSSPDLTLSTNGSANLGAGPIVESPIDDHQDEEYYSDDYDEQDQHMLPPTASTYHHREKPLPKPPTIEELKADLTSALNEASKALVEARANRASPPPDSPLRHRRVEEPNSPQPKTGGWHEIQGMHILDVMTLAIRAAKVYYTAHENPERLDAIKTERQLRSELLGVMDVLKRMATRGFAGGLRDDEAAAMDGWILSLRDMLAAEEAMEAAEAAERAGWTWLDDAGWAGRELERERAFLETLLAGGSGIANTATPPPATTTTTGPTQAMSPTTDQHPPLPPLTPTSPQFLPSPHPPTSQPLPSLPPWTPLDRTSAPSVPQQPTPFLLSLQNGILLVHLHNCAVRRSRRRFGAIPSWHTDTQKPYRAADNLRYWLKAAELRWEVHLRLDALAVVYGAAWGEFEDAVREWCARVRDEISAEVRGQREAESR